MFNYFVPFRLAFSVTVGDPCLRYMTDSEDESTLWEAEREISEAASLLWHEHGLTFSAEVRKAMFLSGFFVLGPFFMAMYCANHENITT